MDKRLFVAGLPYSFDDKALGELFAQFGTVVSASVITDRETGRSKGFGFVEMTTSEEAQAAIQKLGNSDLEGRKLVVNIARPKEERHDNFRRGGFGGNRGGQRDGRQGGGFRGKGARNRY